MGTLDAIVVLAALACVGVLALGAWKLGAAGGRIEAAENAAEAERRTNEWLASKPTPAPQAPGSAPNEDSWLG